MLCRQTVQLSLLQHTRQNRSMHSGWHSTLRWLAIDFQSISTGPMRIIELADRINSSLKHVFHNRVNITVRLERQVWSGKVGRFFGNFFFKSRASLGLEVYGDHSRFRVALFREPVVLLMKGKAQSERFRIVLEFRDHLEHSKATKQLRWTSKFNEYTQLNTAPPERPKKQTIDRY